MENHKEIEDIFYTFPINNGNSFSITSLLGDILISAQDKYGPRDMSYTILGIEFTTKEQPQIWFPRDCKNIAIQITIDCRFNAPKAIYQVAHEAIHCLSPALGEATYLEEGLATYFSQDFTQSFCDIDFQPEIERYHIACNLVKKLLDINPNIIKELRKETPQISALSKEMLVERIPNIPLDLAEKLTTRFSQSI